MTRKQNTCSPVIQVSLTLLSTKRGTRVWGNHGADPGARRRETSQIIRNSSLMLESRQKVSDSFQKSSDISIRNPGHSGMIINKIL